MNLTRGPKLTKEQIESYKTKLVRPEETKPCRFLYKGQALDIISGELASKGSNVIYHVHYWSLPKDVANEIAKVLDAKVVFSE